MKQSVTYVLKIPNNDDDRECKIKMINTKSTRAATPVKSCNTTRPGKKVKELLQWNEIYLRVVWHILVLFQTISNLKKLLPGWNKTSRLSSAIASLSSLFVIRRSASKLSATSDQTLATSLSLDRSAFRIADSNKTRRQNGSLQEKTRE